MHAHTQTGTYILHIYNQKKGGGGRGEGRGEEKEKEETKYKSRLGIQFSDTAHFPRIYKALRLIHSTTKTQTKPNKMMKSVMF